MSYFLMRHQKESGPFSIDELKLMSLLPNDLVRGDDKNAAWMQAKEFDELKPFINYADRQAAFETEIISQGGSQEQKQKSNFFKKQLHAHPLILLGIALVFGIGAWLMIRSINKPEAIAVQPIANAGSEIIIPDGAADSIKEDFKNALEKEAVDSMKLEKQKARNVRKLVSVQPNDYRVKFFGGISNLKITVTNNSDVLLDAISVQVAYLKPKGEVIHTENIWARKIGPHDSKTLEVSPYARGVKVKCKILSIKSGSVVSEEET